MAQSVLVKNANKNKKKNGGLSDGAKVGIIVGVISGVGLIGAVLIIFLCGGFGFLGRSQRDTQREDDLARFLTAVNNYQTNNGGKTPWNGLDHTNEYFVTRYIDSTCVKINTSGKPDKYSCGGDEFRDPDGANYSIYYYGYLNSDVILSEKMSRWPNDHEIWVALNATCGYQDGALDKAYSDKQVAMLYRLENGSITCNDNH